MRALCLVLVAVVSLACQKASTSTSAEEATEPTTAQTGAAVPVAAKPAPAQPAAAEDGKSCGEAMAEGGSCAGGCNQWTEAANDVLRREVPSDAQWTSFAVEGMSCGGCERRIIANVGQLDGIVKVEADAEQGQVRIATLGPSPSVDQAKSRIRELGYRVAE